MVVATFREGTSAAGRQVVYDAGFLQVEGIPISIGQLLEYDQQGQIEWAAPNIREWALSAAALPTLAAPPAAPVSAGPPPQSPPVTARPVPPSRSRSLWPIVAIVGAVIAVLVIVLVVAVVVIVSRDDSSKNPVAASPSAQPTLSPTSATPTVSPTSETTLSPTPEPTPEATLSADEVRVVHFVQDATPDIRQANVLLAGAVRSFGSGNWTGGNRRLEDAARLIVQLKKKWNRLDWVGGYVHDLERAYHRYLRATTNLDLNIYQTSKLGPDWRFHLRKARKALKNVAKFKRAVAGDLEELQVMFPSQLGGGL